MPENDSQQSGDTTKKRKKLIEELLVCKHAFDQVARKYKGRVRYVNQHMVIWPALGLYFSHKNWEGLCVDFSLEWIRKHVRGGDFVKEVIRARNELVTSMKCSNKFFSNLTPVDNTFPHPGLFIGKEFVRYDGWFESRYPFSNAHWNFEEDRYYTIITDGHITVCYVDNDKKMTFYDASIGEAADLSSVKFVGEYFAKQAQLARNSFYQDINESLANDIWKKKYKLTVEVYAPVRPNPSIQEWIMSLLDWG